MATISLSKVLDHLRRTLPAPDGGASDGLLLTRFLSGRDETAFAALVHRHGRMVLGVCRRVLRDAHDAEDAFQAVFLVLARKAGAIVKRESVGSWLYGVAYRVALGARSVNTRRRSRETVVENPPHPVIGPVEAHDWRPLLDGELQRLPEKYRAAVVLCELEERPRREAARLLGVSEGTLSSRLAAARRLLAARLTRRGVAIGVGGLAALAGQAAPAAALTAATVQAASAFAAGRAAAPAIAALTQEVLRTMFLAKCKAVVAAAALAAVLAVGCLSFQAAAGAQATKAARDDKSATDSEALRKENELLRLNLQLTLEKIQKLEAELAALKGRGPARESPFETGWDKPVDPDKDCKFIRDKDSLTIEVPGKDHDFAIERPLMNSPRLLRDVEGDFVAEVRVSGEFKPSFDSTSTARIPFVGAGLVLIESDQTNIRLERATLRRDGEASTYANWELRQDGEWKLAGDATVRPLEDKPTYLRLERKGNKLLASVSHDGDKWSELEPLELKLAPKLKLGLMAGGTSSDPFKPRFDHFKLTQSRKRDS